MQPPVLNFSIAYGKTAHGLANDFKTSREEAQATVDKWYADRFEVREWQEQTRHSAKQQELKVRTLLGPTRALAIRNSLDCKLNRQLGIEEWFGTCKMRAGGMGKVPELPPIKKLQGPAADLAAGGDGGHRKER
ncbi:hypothetical protein TSOC_003440 [Tetrabaena socialis]|uniref:DNA-directed DNA polymerase family A palm domain-containing protein n=1 Tax=Tetrabaena socialis TaxID=47790 RepID=A0A2J8ABI1_9CHLO|nr:hypothetical protein TSOC_003440 [Tetrabaena socialis]|eukprot:PNH09885.1 hypothetical protein TSOC_003440 [Tetrabaena socialis]